jgi:hypothetical protein
METRNEVMIYSQDNLNKELQDIINKQFKNKELIRNINMELAKKNLNTNLTAGLFEDGSVTVNKLSQTEKIAIAKATYETLKIEKVNYRNYFDDSDIIDYNGYMNVEKRITEIELNNLERIDEYNYIGRISYEQIYNYIKFVLFRYNKLSQRAYKTKSLGTKDGVTRVIDINQSNVDAMEELILEPKHKLEDTQIIVNIRLPEGDENFEPSYRFTSLAEMFPAINKIDMSAKDKEELLKSLSTIGTLKVKPNYEIDSPTFTVVDMLDGFHRMLAVYQAVETYKEQNNGAILQGGLDIRVVLRTLSEAQEIIRQIFQRADTNTEFLKGFEQGDYANFLNLVQENSAILRNQIAINFNEHLMNKTLTYKTILIDAIKLTDIPVEQKGKIRDISKKIADGIDEIIEYTKVKYFNDNLDEMKSNSHLLDCNMFVGYLAISNAMRVLNNYDMIDVIVDNLYSIPDSELKKLKLKNSPNTCSYKDVYNYFTNLVMEVINVA